MGGQRAFLVDECVDPDAAYQINSEGTTAEPAKAVLGIGADDLIDILPYAREYDRIVVTSNVTDLRTLDDDNHEARLRYRAPRRRKRGGSKYY